MARIRAQLLEEFDDLLQPVPPELPPFREVNHSIPIIEQGKRYNYHLPRCPEVLKPELIEKIERYTKAGWWVPCRTDQAAPLLCVYKKDGRLRTVVDLRLRNDNTVKDVTPFPDQDNIRDDVARAKYRTKLDMSDAYEQTRIEDDDVAKTAFATIYGTYYSRVMQQGDCNAPSTFQRLMTHLFRDQISRSVHVYLDDIFIFSDTLSDHVSHVRWVLTKLREHHMFLSRKKVNILADSMDCLGHLIDHLGLHADLDKMARVRNWPRPRNYHDVQRFLGLVQYLAHFMPEVSMYTGPLSAITRNGQAFDWRPLHEKCFESVKALACKVPILKPIDHRNPDPIWVITDASTSGVGAVYGQGPAWHNCRPAGFMSKKFTTAQHSYFTFETEALAVVEALMKWHDKLMGRHFTVITDHRALLFLTTKSSVPPRLSRWIEYLSRFDYEVVHVAGDTNRVADALSRFYNSEDADAEHPPYDYVNADARLDPAGEELSNARVAELRAQRVADAKESREVEAAELAAGSASAPSDPTGEVDLDPTVGESAFSDHALNAIMQGQVDIVDDVKRNYPNDALARKILAEPTHHALFVVRNGLIFHHPKPEMRVLYIPNGKVGKRKLVEIILDCVHQTIGHLGLRRTSDYTRRYYWWPTMGRDIGKFCKSCGVCQTTKASKQVPPGLMHHLDIPERMWLHISMDFVGPFTPSGGKDYVWVIMCRMGGHAHLIAICVATRASELAEIFISEIVRHHGIPATIVSDRDPKFTAKFWREVHRILGSRLLMSTAFHPQTDGTTERAVQTVSQVLRAMVRPDQTDWAAKLPLVEFAVNSSRNASTGFAPFELTYGYLPSMIREVRDEAVMPGVRDFAERALNNMLEAHDALIASRVVQTHYANQRRRSENPDETEPDFAVGKLAYLATANLSMPKGRARKLMPKFIGPYKIVEAHPASSTYTLDLPPDLKRRRIHPRFHVSRLRRHEPNDDEVFPHREAHVFYDFGDDPEREYLVDDIVAHEWDGGSVRFLVQWTSGDTSWEPWSTVKELEAVSNYFDLVGVSHWRSLPRRGAPGTPAVGRPRADAPRDASSHGTALGSATATTAPTSGPGDTGNEVPGSGPGQDSELPEGDLGRGKRRKVPSRRAREAAE